MRHNCAATATAAVICGMMVSGCSNSDFPTSPSPVAQTPVTSVEGMKLSGPASLANGSVTVMNMTLIARSVAVRAPGPRLDQEPGTTDVSGNFELVSTGVKGTVTGALDGTIENGTFRGSLTAVGPGCSRQYAGPVTAAGIALVATDTNSSCPLPTSLQIFRIDGPGCTFSVSSVSTVSGAGAKVTVSVATTAVCTWAVESLVPWVRLDGNATATGNGTVALMIDGNSDAARQGTLRVAGQDVTISQGPACTFAVAPTSVNFAPAGGSATTTITAPAACEWRVENVPDWITVAPPTGSGTATITLTAQPQSGPARQAALTIAGQTVTVTQGAGCAFAVSPAIVNFAATGGTAMVTVTAPAGCEWRVENLPPWLAASPAAGSGTVTVTLTAQPQTGTSRQASITIAGQNVTVTQGGCTFVVAPANVPFAVGGGSAQVTVTAPVGCDWRVENLPTWLAASPPSGSGTTPITLTAQPNSGPLRQLSIVIAGQAVTVVQAAVPAPVSVTVIGLPRVNACDDDASCLTFSFGGGSVSSVPAGIQCTHPQELSVTAGSPPPPRTTGPSAPGCTAQFGVGSTVTLTAVPASVSSFVGWAGACSGTAPTCTVTVDAEGTAATATFITHPELLIHITGQGTVTDSGGINCTVGNVPGVCSARLPIGTAITLTAATPPGLVFLGWGGECEDFSTKPACALILTQSTFVSALFGSSPMPVVPAKRGGESFSVSSLPQAAGPRSKEQ